MAERMAAFRHQTESEKQWAARRQFLARHLAEFEAQKRTDQLQSLSMVWVNHVFLGCRYGVDLMEKVLKMAEGIDVGEMPSFELEPAAEAKKKRARSPDGDPGRSTVAKLGPRPRFEPVRFVSGSRDEKENEGESGAAGASGAAPQDSGARASAAPSSFQKVTPYVFDPWVSDPEDGEQLGSSAVEVQKSKGRGALCRGSANKEGPPCGKGRPSVQVERSEPRPISPAVLQHKQRLIATLSSIIAARVKDLKFTSNQGPPNYSFILSRSIQACKTNPEYTYFSLKEILPSDLPRNKKLPVDGYACELRFHSVYLATGYSGSKNGARDQASQQAVKLFLRPVEVRVVQRRYRAAYINDLVVCQVNSPTPALVPALQGSERKLSLGSGSQKEPSHRKRWANFVIVENGQDAICILNNSAALSHMRIDYKFEVMLNQGLWQCGVYLEGELLAQASGTKKVSKRAAAEEALRNLRASQAARLNGAARSQNQGRLDPPRTQQAAQKKDFGELVILENSDNATCIINDTAQFNRVTADYRFTLLPDQRWKCEVYLDDRYVAEGVGPKKSVKHMAAEEALRRLRQTHPVVKSNLRKECNGDGISRDQIAGRAATEHLRQEIKEDNIGNRLLRKMGWMGGGLGREGTGIAEPIVVKEQLAREGLGLDASKAGHQLSKKGLEDIIRSYASSERQDELCFSSELSNDERKQIHQMSQKYGLRSKSYGQGAQRFLVVSRKVQKEQLIGQLLQEGQVGRYELVKPSAPDA
ncbi:NF-kappa-B-repressing factor-like [Arapaima gigas]